MQWRHKDLLGLEELTAEEIDGILEQTRAFREVSQRTVKKVPALQGKTIVNLFLEPSTRTRASFELAAKRLSADIVNFQESSSSLAKGETLKDMARNIEALKVDCIVMRHASSGAPHLLARCVKASIINAGDGAHEHPTQALLDLFTIRDKIGKIEGLRVLFVGDITHSRVARSNIWGMSKFGAKVTVCGPRTLIPYDIGSLGVNVSHDLSSSIRECDVLYLLRIQHERQRRHLFPSNREYARFFGVNESLLNGARKNLLVLHPGPINRGVELSGDASEGPQSLILEQVTNGLAVRMAVLYLVSGSGES
ncbi:MAG: aspartate carbamoyltransferase catalytic subunit [Candidatus Omnitrophica bacterium]|nr:aspartate carbamoyltransferase catalytic subunit [Candidatus Omnitrophota bacterium]